MPWILIRGKAVYLKSSLFSNLNLTKKADVSTGLYGLSHIVNRKTKKTIMRNTFRLFLVALCSIIIFSGCKNGPGTGGRASITGKVHVKNYNSLCVLSSEYYAPDEDVYIIYGDDASYGDRIKTGPDGTFVFNYLRTGKYTIYVYSSTACNTAPTPSGKEAITAQVEITDNKQEVTLTDIEIKK